ncbi:hypothetical protein HOY82DRAFT_482840, partial [Tuber indicum]
RTCLALFNSLIGSIEEEQQQPQALLQPAAAEEPKGATESAKCKRRDPTMPKIPICAYFSFCPPGGHTVNADLGLNATRSDIKAETAKRWSHTPQDMKKDIAAKSLEMYKRDMATYKNANALQTAETSIGFTTADTEQSEAYIDKAELTAGSEDDKEVEESAEDVRSPTPPNSHKAAKTKSKMSGDNNGNGNFKEAFNSIAISGTSTADTSADSDLRAVAETVMRTRTGCKRIVAVEGVEASDEASPKNSATRKRRKNSDLDIFVVLLC